MYTIVPLAGPDCYDGTYGLRPLYPVEGEPLIRRAIASRDWYQSGECDDSQLIFVLREAEQADELARALGELFPAARSVRLPQLTRGALLSALAGMALIEDFTTPIAVDLADILYEADFSPGARFAADATLSGIIPYFKGDDPKYSYLELDGEVVRKTREKQVISEHASAGTYFFRNLPTFLYAVGRSLDAGDQDSVQGTFFLCPAFNGLIDDGKRVIGCEVQNVKPLSLLFH